MHWAETDAALCLIWVSGAWLAGVLPMVALRAERALSVWSVVGVVLVGVWLLFLLGGGLATRAGWL